MYHYIISLTTIPSKFDNLYLTIDSIISQTILPDKIIINIPKIYDFRMNNTSISDEKLSSFKEKYSKYNVCINLLDKDYGPGTKLLGLINSKILEDDNITQNTVIILIDDDLIYKPYVIEHFENYIKTNKNVDLGSYDVEYYNIRIGKGADCYFIKLNTMNKFTDYYNLIKEQDYIFYHDDYFISYYFYLMDKYIYHINAPHNSLIYSLHENSFIDGLHKIEGKYSRDNLYLKSYEILNNLNATGVFDLLKLTN
jgi:hypothetical protein